MADAFRKIWRILDKKQRRNLVLLFILMLIGAFFELMSISLMIPIVTGILNGNVNADGGYMFPIRKLLMIFGEKDAVLYGIIVFIILFIVKTLFLFFEYRMQYRFAFRNRFRLQKQLLHSYLGRPYEFYLNVGTGDIIRTLNNDVFNTFNLLATMLSFATETIVSLILIVAVFLISPVMTAAVAGVILILVIIIVAVLKPYQRERGRKRNRMIAQMNKWLIQAVSGIREIKIGNKERYFENNFSRYGEEAAKIDEAQTLLNNTPRILVEMVSVCSVLVVTAVMIKTGTSPELLVPKLSAFALAAVRLIPCMNRIATSMNQLNFSKPSLDNVVNNIMTRDDDEYSEKASCELDEHPGAAGGGDIPEGRKNSFEKGIEFRNITYRYPGSDEPVLENASFEIPSRSCTGIIGMSGAGKTTAADILAGLLAPEEGEILLDGKDVRDDISAWLSLIGYIPQNTFMLDDSIRVNVAFGPEGGNNDEKVWKALEEAQLDDFVRSLPEGIDTQIGERGIRLSGGQRQRIGIARALYEDPAVLIFDEATSALDTETESAVMDSVYDLQGRRTLIIITHRRETIERCDRIYEVKDKKIVLKKGSSAEP